MRIARLALRLQAAGSKLKMKWNLALQWSSAVIKSGYQVLELLGAVLDAQSKMVAVHIT